MHIRMIFFLAIFTLSLTACAGHKQPSLTGLPSEAKSDQRHDDTPSLDDQSRYQTPQLEDIQPYLAEPQLDTLGQTAVDLDTPLTEAEQRALDAPLDFQFVLDIKETREVERYFRYFTHEARNTFQAWLKRSELYLPQVRDIFLSYGLPHDLIYLPFIESGYNPMAYSRAGAGGMWQFMPGTGKIYGLSFDWWLDQRRDPLLATHAAAEHLAKLYAMFNDWNLALAAYNAGEGRIARAMQRSGTDNYFDLAAVNNLLARETQDYVPKFMAVLKIVQNLEELGFEPIDWSNGPNLTTVEIKGGTDLVALADHCGLSWETFRQFNPAFRRQVSPPDRKLTVCVPEDKREKAVAFARKPSSSPQGFERYQVRRGDSWWVLSSRFKTPVDVLKRINNKNTNMLRTGESLMVPRGASAQASRQSSDAIVATKERASQRANYVIQSGDTLWSLSRKFGVAVSTLEQANGLTNRNTLRIGQRLYIPQISQTASAARSAPNARSGNVVQYRVRSGDTLWRIAQQFGVSTNNLVAWNKLPRNGLIRPGDNLKIYVP